MAAAFSTSQPATSSSPDAALRASRQLASFRRWRRSLGRSISIRKALVEHQPEPKATELYGPPTTRLRRTRTARPPDVESRPTDVPLKEDSPSTPPNTKERQV